MSNKTATSAACNSVSITTLAMMFVCAMLSVAAFVIFGDFGTAPVADAPTASTLFNAITNAR